MEHVIWQLLNNWSRIVFHWIIWIQNRNDKKISLIYIFYQVDIKDQKKIIKTSNMVGCVQCAPTESSFWRRRSPTTFDMLDLLTSQYLRIGLLVSCSWIISYHSFYLTFCVWFHCMWNSINFLYCSRNCHETCQWRQKTVWSEK